MIHRSSLYNEADATDDTISDYTMDSPEGLIPATLLSRYKRFLMDVRLEDGSKITVHCPNSGSLRGCVETGRRVLLSRSTNPERRTAFTCEFIHDGTVWIGINTHRTNRIAVDAVREKLVPELTGYTGIEVERPYGKRSRIDILLKKDDELCYVEVKSVTLLEEDGVAAFPDAVTTRGRRHLEELMGMVDAGHRAVMLFIVQREDGHSFRPASSIDPDYARSLRTAHDYGVEILPYVAAVRPPAITLHRRIPLSWP